jgi:hypothetical protein
VKFTQWHNLFEVSATDSRCQEMIDRSNRKSAECFALAVPLKLLKKVRLAD